jgi:DNA polymerase-1
MPERPLILLLDGNALVHRAYHAIPPLTSASGEPTNATFGFTATLLKVLHELKPKYAVVAFDIGRTFRHEQYAEYKGTRPSTPDDLRVQLERTRDVVAAFRLPSKYLEGYEADDVLATLAKKASERGLDVIIITGDTDTLQLVGPHVRVLLSGRKFTDTKLYDEVAIRERYGLQPGQLVDLKALKGDTSDNVPGIPGVGDVTATRLLQQFGSVDNMYQHIEQVELKLRGKLEANEANLRRNQGLIKLVDALPVELDLEDCRVGAYDRTAVSELFRELNFHKLLLKLPRTTERPSAQLSFFGGDAAPQSTEAKPALGQYHLVDTEAGLQDLLSRIRATGACALDAETTSLQPMEAELVGIALAYQPGEGYYIPVGHAPGTTSAAMLPLDLVRARLGPLLEDAKIAKYAHNANYDMIVLQQHGIAVHGLAFDTMLAAYLLDPTGRNLGLKGLAWQELGVEMTPIEELIGKGKGQITMNLVAAERVAPYASADADMTLRLVQHLERPLKEKQLWTLFSTVEIPLVPVLMDMECTGVALDVAFLKQMSQELATRLGELEQQIQQQVGYALNLNSSQQLGDALFTKLGLPTEGVPRGTSGRFSTAAEVLESLKGKHPVMDLLLEHRQLSKIKSTYVDALPLLVNPRTGRVHTSWNQTGTVTGRLSSSDPNLQNIPIRSDIGRRVRQAFVARPGCMLLAADYSQVELRILAHLSGDENLLAAFRRGEDIHARTAASILGVPLEQVTPDMRRLAKSINFGLVYGMSGWGLAARTELTQQQASDFSAKYFAQFPRVRGYLAQVKQQAADQGYVETLLGRKRYFPELQAGSKVPGAVRSAAQRMAINHPIQGAAADIIKIAMIHLHDELQKRGLGSKMILQVHDELVLEVPDEEVGAVSELVRSTMEGAYKLDAALKVDIKTGRHWGEME